MTDRYILDKKGNPIEEPDIIKWGKFFESKDRIVKQEHVGQYYISTVFLGLDHSFDYFPNHTPILFESMVFDESNKHHFTFGGSRYEIRQDLEKIRYATKKEALAGHKKLVKKYAKQTTAK